MSKASAGIRWQSDKLTAQFAANIAAAWEGLAHASIEKNIFNFPWFVIPSIPLLEDKNPEILTIYDGDLLIGLLVLCPDRGYAKLPLPFLRTALHPDQFLGMPLIREGYAQQFADGLCQWLDAAPSNVSFLLLHSLAADNAFMEALVATCKAQNRKLIETERFERAAIGEKARNAADPDSLLSKNRRKSLRRKLKQLGEQGEVKVEKLNHFDDLDQWIGEFLEMENSGWKKEGASSILSQPKDETFYYAMLPEAFRNKALNFFRLCVDGKPIAYTLDLISAPDAYCMKTAFDQEFKKFSPGILMEYETLKFYADKPEFRLVDSCTDPSNEMLNEVWPDRKAITSLLISRTGEPYRSLFSAAYILKSSGMRFVKSLPSRNESGNDRSGYGYRKIC